jgi:hypothetical protein
VETASGTFAENYADTESVERLKPYITRIQTPIDETANILGVIVSVNGKVESMDVFESTPLFRKLWPKLLKSYALDASNADVDEQSTRVATRDDALSFLRETAKAQATKTDSESVLALSRGESDRGAAIYRARDSAAVCRRAVNGRWWIRRWRHGWRHGRRNVREPFTAPDSPNDFRNTSCTTATDRPRDCVVLTLSLSYLAVGFHLPGNSISRGGSPVWQCIYIGQGALEDARYRDPTRFTP